MSLIYCDTCLTVSSSTDRRNDGNPSNVQFGRQVRSNEANTTFIIGKAFKCAFGTAVPIFDFREVTPNIVHVEIMINANGSIEAFRGTSSGVSLGVSAAGAFPFDAGYHYVEAKAVLSDTVGTVEVRVDAAPVLILSGLDTKNGGTLGKFDGFLHRTLGTNANSRDLYLCNGAGSVNNDFLGPVRIVHLAPNGNGTYSGMDGSDGNQVNNYQLVDENPIDTADYVQGGAGQKDSYDFPAVTYVNDVGATVTPSGSVIAGVIEWSTAEKIDTSLVALNLLSRLSGTDSSVAAVGANPPFPILVDATFHHFDRIMETKPGGGAWTVADVNAAEFGVEII